VVNNIFQILILSVIFIDLFRVFFLLIVDLGVVQLVDFFDFFNLSFFQLLNF